MRVVFINPEYPPIGGGAANACYHLAHILTQYGHQVAVLTAHFRHLPRYENQKGVHIWRIFSRRKRAERSGALEQGLFILSGLPALLRLVHQWRPQVLVAFFGAPSGMLAWAVQRWVRLPYVVLLRGGDVPGFRPYDFRMYHQLIGPILRRVWRQAAAVVANSEGLRALAQRFDPTVSIRVIPNGVDPQRFAPPKKRTWDPPRLLFVGRVVYQKGLDVLLEALAGLSTPQHWHLTLVGDGPYRPTLEALAAGRGLRERVTFAGWQPPERIPTFYREANLFVFPSRDEGMPNAVLEAMASGLPIVATRIAGNEELVTPEVGVLVPKDDPAALREALLRLLPDSASRQRLGAAARQRVRQHFTWEATARQYLALFHEVQ